MSTLLTVITKRKELTGKIVLPTVIYTSSLVLVLISPKWLYPQHYSSPIKYRGCYEGTINTGTIFFRESGDFEYRHVGWFGITTFEKGTWTQTGDTLKIEYENAVPDFVGDKLVLTEDWFYKVEGDSLITNRLGFYRGFCKGLN